MSNLKPSKFWCLLNADSGLNLEGLTFNEARAAVSALPLDSRIDWVVWREGWQRWKPLVQVRELLEPLNRSLETLPPPYESQIDQVESQILHAFRQDEDEDAAASEAVVEANTATRDLEITDHQFIERIHKRLKRRFKVHINQGANKFTTHTVDVSVGGLLLEDVLPDWVAGYCQVILVRPNSKQAIEVTCFLVENQGPKNRRRLQIVALKDKAAEDQLEQWLAAA